MIRRRALLAAPLLAAPALAQARARVVVVGGGFGGAAAARALRRADPTIAVTLVTGGADFSACPMSNAVIAGLRDPARQSFGYAGLAADDIAIAPQRAEAIAPESRQVRLEGSVRLDYDRLVLAPGVAPVWGAIRGYDAQAATRMPHGWGGGAQMLALRAAVAALPRGATVVIAVPATPYRCPPAPYERASLIAHAMTARGLGGKILILDSKDSFSQQAQFRQAWAALYPGLIEWIGLSDGGGLAEVDAAAGTLATDFETFTPALANVIPPQRAAPIAAVAADRTGWCPVDPDSFLSTLHPAIHVIGDAAFAGQMSKSASGAIAQARLVAGVIAADLAQRPRPQPALSSTCYSAVAPDWAFVIRNTYHRQADTLAENPGGGTSALDAPPAQRAAYARVAEEWFDDATHAIFG